MFVKQISVFIENKPGRLVEITRAIADAGLDLRAVSLADTSDFGILRVIVDDPKKAEQVLKDQGNTVALTRVIAVGVEDRPGKFSDALKVLSDNSISIEYMYAFTGHLAGTAHVIMKLDDLDLGAKVLADHGFRILTCDEMKNL